ncbi:unnamed protein product [Rhizophagus irregularis]|uniref:Uncharacterized protein n=1 Tax=Rhizophagus irregularis TaxID=588596 RepID=A0A915Z7M3_9GLOM|nr:unnamed protein product [Rhizophagus irregularis]CAB5363734.1 unnamed protein product [Rhizophagus irregularis]
MINEVTRVVKMEGREKCQALGNLHKNNQDNNASSIQHTSDERSQQQKQKEYLDQDNIEEVVESLTNEESINAFLARQRLRFVKGKLNDQETKNSMFLEMHIAAHNIDGIASVPSIQKLHNLLEFGKEIISTLWLYQKPIQTIVRNIL